MGNGYDFELCHHGGVFDDCQDCQENLKALEQQTFTKLRMKRGILIKVIKEDPDNRYKGFPQLRQQRAVLDLAITNKLERQRQEEGRPKPPAQTIGMKPVRVDGRAVA